MLDRICNICATLTIATYAIFTVLGHPTIALFIITTPPVVMGIFRYILLVERDQEGEAPDAILFKDRGHSTGHVIWAILLRLRSSTSICKSMSSNREGVLVQFRPWFD